MARKGYKQTPEHHKAYRKDRDRVRDEFLVNQGYQILRVST